MTTNDLMALFEENYRRSVAFDRFLGMTLTVNAVGDVTYTLTVGPDHLTAKDSAHGGVAAAMMDGALGVAALSFAVSRGNLCATVEFKINYLRQVRPGDRLMAHGTVKHTGKRLIVSECDIREQQSGDLVATGLGTFTQYPMDRRQDVLGETKP
ncbi:hypothetical protein JCM14469_02090 [Desulfatiferula olefinivorans]